MRIKKGPTIRGISQHRAGECNTDQALQEALQQLYGGISKQPLPREMADLADLLDKELGKRNRATKNDEG